MIIKIKTRNKPSFRQLLNYITRGKDKLFDAQGNSFLITQNVRGDSLEGFVWQYKNNEKYRTRKRSDNVILSHEIVSFHKDDTISLEILEDMAKQYIQLRNPNGMFVSVPHYDKNHLHIHFCVSGVEYKTGKSMRLSKSAMRELKINFQKYQLEKYPRLVHSVVDFEKGKTKGKAMSDEEFQFKLRTKRETDKEIIHGILNECYQRAGSPEQFFDLVKGKEIELYERGKKTTGLVFKNRKFRFNKLGYDQNRIDELSRELALRKIRNSKVTRSINR